MAPKQVESRPHHPRRVRLPRFITEEEIGLGDLVKRVTYAVGIDHAAAVLVAPLHSTAGLCSSAGVRSRLGAVERDAGGNAMADRNLPAFTAEAALGRTATHYRGKSRNGREILTERIVPQLQKTFCHTIPTTSAGTCCTSAPIPFRTAIRRSPVQEGLGLRSSAPRCRVFFRVPKAPQFHPGRPQRIRSCCATFGRDRS